jgi:hypothetical protein
MKPRIDFGQSSKAFSKTLRRYADLSSKGAAEAINKKAKDVCIRSISQTPMADKGAIKTTLQADGLAFKLVNKTGLTKDQIKQKAAALIRARTGSVRYIKAGWYKALQVFGGRGGKTRPDGLADKGTGSKASPRDLTAVMENKAFGATQVGGDALARAMDSVRKDMMVYIQRKAREAWGKKGR